LGGIVRDAIGSFNLKFILNQVRTQADSEVGYGIRNVCRKYFGVSIDYLGFLEYDSAVWQSVRRRRPLAVEFPSSPIMPKIQNFVGQLLSEEAERLRRGKAGA
jgi:flagellar biosynthesis protein FlhG